MPPIDFFLNEHAQYYISYDFKRLLQLAGFLLKKMILVKERVMLEEGEQDVLVLKAVILDPNMAMFCYPTIYPRFFSECIDESILGECDNAYIRFSIFFDKTGFFSPLWESVIKGERQLTPEGLRIDWDVMAGRAPQMTSQRYHYLLKQAEQRTYIENQEVVMRTLPIWLRSTAVLQKDIDPII